MAEIKKGQYRKKLKHLNTPGAAHYLTFSTYNRYPLLGNNAPCEWLCDAINSAREKHHFSLWAYVFMPDHVHLLIFPESNEYDIGKILAAVKTPVSRKAVAYWKRNNPEIIAKVTVKQKGRLIRRFWEAGGGYDREILELDAYKNSAEYIHNNPIVKGLCETPTDWKWSSARWYAGLPGQPLEIDETMPVLK